MDKKLNMTSDSLQNLKVGPSSHEPHVKKKPPEKSKGKTYVNRGTTMSSNYTRHNPSPTLETKLDKLYQQSIDTITRLDKSRAKTEPHTVKVTTMMLQFVFNFLVNEKCTLTTAVERASIIILCFPDSVFCLTIVSDFFLTTVSDF